MDRTGSTRGIGERRWVNTLLGALAWLLGLVFFFPIIWVVLSSFKNELDAVGDPTLVFDASTERYREVASSTPGILSFGTAFANSAFVVLVSTAIVLVMAVPAAYALAIRPVRKWRDVLMFFISTKFLPMVAAILPLFILAKEFGLLGSLSAWAVLARIMEVPFVFSGRAVAQALGVALALVLALGGLGTWRVLRTPSVPQLRSE